MEAKNVRLNVINQDIIVLNLMLKAGMMIPEINLFKKQSPKHDVSGLRALLMLKS